MIKYLRINGGMVLSSIVTPNANRIYSVNSNLAQKLSKMFSEVEIKILCGV